MGVSQFFGGVLRTRIAVYWARSWGPPIIPVKWGLGFQVCWLQDLGGPKAETMCRVKAESS